MLRHLLTDREFNAIRPLLPKAKTGQPGRPWADHRTTINAILWVLKTGAPWRDVPAELGKWQTAYNRFRRWTCSGLWDSINRALLKLLDTRGKISRQRWCIDGSVVRAHRCASGMLPKSPENDDLNALGYSRGGYSTKLHLLTDGNGIVLGVTATAGQRHESTEFEKLLANCELSMHRRRRRPQAIVGDRGYNSEATRQWLKRRSIADVIPTRSNEQPNLHFDRATYRARNIIERSIGWLKESRRIATRYDKLTSSYLTFITLASIRRMIQLI